ncbi:MAG: SMP-30/gluconolactonase/LRE family protein [Blastocatellia bacterium]
MPDRSNGLIKNVRPQAGVEGGEVILTCEGYDTSDYSACRVLFGDGEQGRFVSASPSRVIVSIPEYGIGAGGKGMSLEGGGRASQARFTLGTKLADGLHPVANPAIDRDDGTIYVTLSGSRGQKVSASIYKITPDDSVTPFISDDIVNPTGMAFNREGTLYVTSRYDGTLYRISHFKEVQTVATDLGVATGVVFDRRGELYVGDRTGTVFRVNEIGEARPFASLEPSVSAYHMAYGPDGDLYVTGPTVSSFESVMRVNSMGDASIFYRGLGRPQGLAFDVQGNLYTAASLHGHRGVVRISPDGSNAEVVVSGSALVGLAFDEAGNMIVVSTQCVYRVPMGIKGYSVF